MLSSKHRTASSTPARGAAACTIGHYKPWGKRPLNHHITELPRTLCRACSVVVTATVTTIKTSRTLRIGSLAISRLPTKTRMGQSLETVHLILTQRRHPVQPTQQCKSLSVHSLISSITNICKRGFIIGSVCVYLRKTLWKA